jgi:hypothetical protein
VPWFWAVTGGAIVVLVSALIAVSILRDENGSEPNAALERGPVHIHGLGVNTADGALYIATHTGMWRVAPGEQAAKPVGDSRQDTMGFTVIGPNHFLGSGHPDNLSQPPLLGLIESTDTGSTWEPISLLGAADFHVLRAVGKSVYGYDASHGRLLISHDQGKNWTKLRPPEPLIDVVVNPSKPKQLLASTARVLIRSADEGRTWKAVVPGAGLLAWPTSERMFLVDGRGIVHVTANAGSDWKKLGQVGGPPAAFLATSPTDLYVALHDGTIKRSQDGGATWRVRSKA